MAEVYNIPYISHKSNNLTEFPKKYSIRTIIYYLPFKFLILEFFSILEFKLKYYRVKHRHYFSAKPVQSYLDVYLHNTTDSSNSVCRIS